MTHQAIFYKVGSDNNECRKVLHLKKEVIKTKRQDLTIIMLNPGSANNKDTKLDPTLHRIRALMEKSNRLNWVQVLNLFDIKNPQSIDFFKFLEKAKKADNDIIEKYSLFTNTRKHLLNDFLKKGDKVYLAWGTNKKKELFIDINHVLKIINDEIKADIINLNTERKFFHPLSRKPGWSDVLIKHFFLVL